MSDEGCDEGKIYDFELYELFISGTISISDLNTLCELIRIYLNSNVQISFNCSNPDSISSEISGLIPRSYTTYNIPILFESGKNFLYWKTILKLDERKLKLSII